MKVSSISGVIKTVVPDVAEDKSVLQEYKALIEQYYSASPYQTRDEINSNDTELEQFRNDLRVKGAAVFLKDMADEKIEALVEKYRQKLLKEKEQNPDKPMDIESMVNDFRKQLMKELMEAEKAEREKKPMDTISQPSSERLQNLKMLRDDEKASGLPEIGFLTQLLNSSNRFFIEPSKS